MAQGAMVQFIAADRGNRATIPQTAVLASSAVGMISGSGAATPRWSGAFTIPLMKRYGFQESSPGRWRRSFHGRAHHAAGDGGRRFRDGGIPWRVLLERYAPRLRPRLHLLPPTLGLSVYLLSVRLMPPDPIEKTTIPMYEQIKTGIFFLGIIFLTILMGLLNYGEQLAGLYTGAFMFALLILLFLSSKYVEGLCGG